MKQVSPLTTDIGETYTVSERVIQAIPDCEGVSPLDISPPLFDAIDPDALDRVYADGRPGVTTEFQYAGFRVTVRPSGRIELSPLGT